MRILGTNRMEMERRTRVEQPQGQDLRRSSSDITIYYDFGDIAVLTAWIRRQKIDLSYAANFIQVLFKMTLCFVERVALLVILIGAERSRIHETRFWEVISTLSLWIIGVLSTIFLKMAFQRNLNNEAPFCSNQVGGVWNAMLLIMKPCKYKRAFLHRKYKLTVLGKEFIHGATVTMEQFEYILRVNREELVDARDDLHDAFLQRIPMAILQFYYFVHSACSPSIWNLTNCLRILVVILDLIATIQITKTYEFKRHIYLDTLHVRGYLTTNGRYPVPKWTENCIAPALKSISIYTAILSRFFLVSFAASVSFGHGIVCLLILFLTNWILVVLFPSLLSTVENLPLGIPLRASYFINRWINTFSGTATRFFELSRIRVNFFSCRKRFPLCIAQLLNFGLAYILVFCFVELMAPTKVAHSNAVTQSPITFFTNETDVLDSLYNKSLKISGKYNVTFPTVETTTLVPEQGTTTFATEQEPTFTTENDTATNTTEYIVTLPFCEFVKLSKGARFFSKVISGTADFLRISYSNPSGNFYRFFHFHWVLFYLHIIITLVYNYYSSSYMRVDNKEDFVPPMISLGLYKLIFKKIFENRTGPNYLTHLSRLLFVISLDLKHFNTLYLSYCRGDSTVNSAAWWDTQILDVVQKYDYGKTRYRDNSDLIPSLISLPIEGQINDAYAAIQNIDYSFRLYVYCANRIDHILMKEMTSTRLEATIAMLQLDRSEMLNLLEISSVQCN